MEMLKAEAVVRLSDPAGVRDALFEHFRDFVTFSIEGEKVSYSSEFGDGYLAAEDAHLRVGIACTEAGTLAMYKDYLAEHVLEFSNESPHFVWTGFGAGEAGIPNFRVVQVVSAHFVTPKMRRVFRRMLQSSSLGYGSCDISNIAVNVTGGMSPHINVTMNCCPALAKP